MAIIIVGSKTPKVINTENIVSMHLSKGITSVYYMTAGADPIPDLRVKQPWTLVITTVLREEYINCANFDEALNTLTMIVADMANFEDDTAELFKKEMRIKYEQ